MTTTAEPGRAGGDDLPAKVKKLMRGLVEDLYRLVPIQAVYRGRNSPELRQAADLVRKLLIGAVWRTPS